MGQFKPMVKMETTEPSVILKLKKGGHVSMKSKSESGHKPMHKMDGGVMGALAGTPALVGRPAINAPVRAPGKPSMAARRAAMMGKRAMPAAVMKKGGEAESPAEHKAEMKKIGKIEGELKSHEDKPASKAHKGLATGGVIKGQGGFKTGGVVKGAGGYKKGGAAKKFADGGRIDSGRPVEMPEGHKKPTPPVTINQLSGTFKKGGAIKKQVGGALPKSATIVREKVTTSAPTPQERERMRAQIEAQTAERNENVGFDRFKKEILPDQMNKILPRKKGGKVC